jgi:plastocyanin
MVRSGRAVVRQALLGLWLSVLGSGAAVAADLAGRLVLFADGRPLRAAEATEAVIYWRPAKPVAVQPAAEPYVMLTRRKQFQPRLLPVTAGSSVRFPNEDPILHNVFSTSPDNAFDAGLYGTGPGVLHTFRSPGLVKVYCNVHHSMFAFILVLDTPHFTRADAAGEFRLAGVAPGDGELVVFHDRAQPLRRRLTLPLAESLDLRLELNKRRVPPHMNKFGRPYGAPPGERSY